MSKKFSKTTADYLKWDTAMMLIHKLFRDKEYRISLLIASGCMLGLRISDLLTLSWAMLLNDENLHIVEHKTHKMREIRLNKEFQRHVQNCYDALQISNPNEKCFLSQKNTVYSIQRINVILKTIKEKYDLKDIEHISSHSLRKTFGRHIFERASRQNNAESALVLLSELFNHSSVQITKRYLGLRKQELLHCYDLLDF